MKKNNTYLTDDEIDLNDLIKVLWREKIVILSISIVCGLVGYLFASFKFKEEFKTEITIKKPPTELFEMYYFLPFNDNKVKNIDEQFIDSFILNFLSTNNLQSFLEESKKFDNFKEYLKSRNISTNNYFMNKINQVKEKNLIIPNKFFLVFSKELDGDTFFNDYAEFTKKKIIFEIKKNIKLIIENKIFIFENALENAKLINLENPILISPNQQTRDINNPEALFYKGSKILSQEIIHLKKLLLKLENEQFNFEMIVDKPFNSPFGKISNFKYVAAGLIFGLFLSLGIIFLRIF
jgi:LPS O-antigen subunit length determinant protein (WzzB/FepE family)